MITAPRAFLLLTGAAIAVSAPPALAQVPESVTLNIMRECAKIEDPTARLACYDNNIRAAGANPHSVPGQMGVPRGGGAVVNPNSVGGFGAEDVKTPDRFHPYGEGSSRGPSQITAQVAAVRERQPGIYLLTLSDGAQWLFSEGGGPAYRPPRKGDSVELQHGALGSYLIVVGNQAAIHVTRVK